MMPQPSCDQEVTSQTLRWWSNVGGPCVPEDTLHAFPQRPAACYCIAHCEENSPSESKPPPVVRALLCEYVPNVSLRK